MNWSWLKLVLPVCCLVAGGAFVVLPKTTSEVPTVASLSNSQQRYRLGSEALARGNFSEARRQLQGLAATYPALAERIDLKLALSRSEGWTWINAHPRSVLVPDALAHLAIRQDRQAIERLLSAYPDHFRTREALESLLVRSADERRHLAHLIRHFPESTLAYTMALRLEAMGSLSASDWQALGAGYRRVAPARAEIAYRKAALTPENLLARAQVLKRLNQPAQAREVLIELARRHPRSPLVVDSQLERTTIMPAAEALALLRTVEGAHPERGDELVWAMTQIQTKRLKGSAFGLYRELVERYPASTKAPNAAWELAADAAARGNIATAQLYARWLVRYHPKDPFAPKAAFSLGKWAEQAGDRPAARTQFRAVLKNWPHSYYAWRSAARLGLVSGDYNIEKLPVPVEWSRPSQPILATSPAFRELLTRGDLAEAEEQWKSETYRQVLSPDQQLSEALLRSRLGENLRSINQSTLALAKLPGTGGPRREQAYPLFFARPLREWSQEREINPLLVASLIRQESRFEPAIRSRSGAVGLMQLMPATARWIVGQEPGQYKLTTPDDNLRLGTWYLRYTHQKFNGNSVLAIASYNAGPGTVGRWVKQYPLDDLESFIEQIPYRETRFYVVNVYENYWNYLRLYTGLRIASGA